MSVTARLEHGELNAQQELGEILQAAGDDGAVVSFVGVARRGSKSGSEVRQLLLEHHPTMRSHAPHPRVSM
jgi:molybdopterin synthase catalytic subunit